eukprot:403344285
MNIGQRIFFRLYPNQPKYADTEEGDRLRNILKICCIFHIVFFMASLTAIGFYSMIQEILYAAWTYSAYLTLKEYQTVIYIVTLFMGIAYGFFNLFSHNDLNLLFYILNLVYYGCALFFVAKAYKTFRITGGIHGKNGTLKPKPDDKSSLNSSVKSKTTTGNKLHSAKKEGLTDNLLEEGHTRHESDEERGPRVN